MCYLLQHFRAYPLSHSIYYYDKLPLLKNDTDEVIEYVENKTSKNKKKYHFWKLLDNAQ